MVQSDFKSDEKKYFVHLGFVAFFKVFSFFFFSSAHLLTFRYFFLGILYTKLILRFRRKRWCIHFLWENSGNRSTEVRFGWNFLFFSILLGLRRFLLGFSFFSYVLLRFYSFPSIFLCFPVVFIHLYRFWVCPFWLLLPGFCPFLVFLC